MGLPSARRKRTNIGQCDFAEQPDSERGDPQRLINPVGFDKVRPPCAAMALDNTGSMADDASRADRYESRESKNHKKKPGHNGRAFDFRKPRWG
jgi:hypothetical protein